MKSRSNYFIICPLVILVLFEGTAHAYIDPGTGSLIWQLLFSAAVGALFYFHKAILRLKTLRERRKADSADDSASPATLKSSLGADESPPSNVEER
jgi:O-antigen/teichoic acid export membrane protein